MYNIVGNVWEWVDDAWCPDGSEGVPGGHKALRPAQPASCKSTARSRKHAHPSEVQRVKKGGSFMVRALQVQMRRQLVIVPDRPFAVPHEPMLPLPLLRAVREHG